ncbi:Tm-1-like ATP-binding domain-containing protein [Pontibacillus litoralis]|uniref:Uncharacterized protein n=1 Tax=Pontibacillus litoralis JSM 072002 TaxID=1385512 RepID=A0A0A5G696_9BACI|nr:Tm-1-like ATP-binding domain-containing protein [Pontibacillus litoralis]KGX87539.1 hypothetical protein N784_14935 [Pontibacillus litoralis JSM 072002]
MPKTIALAGTLDSKGEEFLYVKEMIESLGFRAFVIHTGVFDPLFKPDVSSSEIAAAVGENMKDLAAKKDRGKATAVLAQGLETLLPTLYEQGKFDGILSFGGSGGTSIATAGMRALPIGVPKLMVSTVASGNTESYIGTSDIMFMPSIVDVAGLNVISKKIFSNAVHSMAGMLTFEHKKEEKKKPLIAATMFGVTTPCVEKAKISLENLGYEVLIFHATGVGGRTMEQLIEAGFIDGVLDLTTTEWADQLVGGVLAAGEHRLEAAAKHHIPQVISVGALDMVNFGPYETVPTQFAHRNLYKHNPNITLMRTNVEENKMIAKKLAEKINMANKYTALMLPLLGVSALDEEGQAFYGDEEDKVLFTTLKDHLDENIAEVIEMDAHINDESFAVASAVKLHQFIQQKKGAYGYAN